MTGEGFRKEVHMALSFEEDILEEQVIPKQGRFLQKR